MRAAGLKTAAGKDATDAPPLPTGEAPHGVLLLRGPLKQLQVLAMVTKNSKASTTAERFKPLVARSKWVPEDALKAELESAQGLEGLPERQRKCNEANQFVVVVVVELSTGELTCQHSTATGSSKVEDRGPWEYVLEHGRKRTGELPSFGYNGSIKPHRVSAGTPSISLIAADCA